jgi:hypothetical protein
VSGSPCSNQWCSTGWVTCQNSDAALEDVADGCRYAGPLCCLAHCCCCNCGHTSQVWLVLRDQQLVVPDSRKGGCRRSRDCLLLLLMACIACCSVAHVSTQMCVLREACDVSAVACTEQQPCAVRATLHHSIYELLLC